MSELTNRKMAKLLLITGLTLAVVALAAWQVRAAPVTNSISATDTALARQTTSEQVSQEELDAAAKKILIDSYEKQLINPLSTEVQIQGAKLMLAKLRDENAKI